jgi:hypothetical protein
MGTQRSYPVRFERVANEPFLVSTHVRDREMNALSKLAICQSGTGLNFWGGTLLKATFRDPGF